MSTRKGDRSKKGQKYQNKTAFRNNLYDNSKRTKQINNQEVGGVCARCKDVIEWRKKFKKYKPLAAPKKCIKCQQKAVKHAYHTVCSNCAQVAGVCEKCGVKQEIVVKAKPTPSEQAAQDSMMQEEIKMMTERQRRSFFRALDTGTGSENPSGSHSTGDTESMEDSQDLPDCSGNKSENDSDEDLS